MKVFVLLSVLCLLTGCAGMPLPPSAIVPTSAPMAITQAQVIAPAPFDTVQVGWGTCACCFGQADIVQIRAGDFLAWQDASAAQDATNANLTAVVQPLWPVTLIRVRRFYK